MPSSRLHHLALAALLLAAMTDPSESAAAAPAYPTRNLRVGRQLAKGGNGNKGGNKVAAPTSTTTSTTTTSIVAAGIVESAEPAASPGNSGKNKDNGKKDEGESSPGNSGGPGKSANRGFKIDIIAPDLDEAKLPVEVVETESVGQRKQREKAEAEAQALQDEEDSAPEDDERETDDPVDDIVDDDDDGKGNGKGNGGGNKPDNSNKPGHAQKKERDPNAPDDEAPAEPSAKKAAAVKKPHPKIENVAVIVTDEPDTLKPEPREEIDEPEDQEDEDDDDDDGEVTEDPLAGAEVSDVEEPDLAAEKLAEIEAAKTGNPNAKAKQVKARRG